MFENRVLREMSGSKKGMVREEWRRLHNEKLYYLHCILNIIGMINSKRMRQAGSVALTGRGEVHIHYNYYIIPLWIPRRPEEFKVTMCVAV